MASKGSRAAGATAIQTKTSPDEVKPRPLPMYRVILHNDDKNDFAHVLQSIVMLTPLGKEEAAQRTMEAHETGCALLLVTHKERAELYAEQFQSLSLTVTIEPAE